MSRLATLKHLQDYIQQHDAGNKALKQSFWRLTKSRHNSRSLTLESPYQAEQLREEFQARTRVAVSAPQGDGYDDDNAEGVEPTLVSEEKNNHQSTTTFQLVDTLEELSRNKENHPSTKEAARQDTAGLRQRKQQHDATGKAAAAATTTTEEENSWTIVEEQNNQQQLQEENELHDPLQLFGGGLTPRELQTAQQEAKRALQSYIEAANQAAAILSLVSNNSDAKR
jgi:hypothetical protein